MQNSSDPGLSCFLCSEKSSDIKKLKFHLILKHPKSHICLFCIEKKGWSSEFPSQVSYNEHYQTKHSGVIEKRAEKRLEEKKIERQQAFEAKEEIRRTKIAKREEESIVRRMRDPKSCKHCEEFPIFDSGYERDKHLISSHNYDFCKICKLIGPAFDIMVHIAQHHQKQLCHLCGSQSPIFINPQKVKVHIEKNHGGSSCPKYSCPNCDNLPLPDLESYVEHFRVKHNCTGVGLRLLKRKRNLRNQENNQQAILNPISGLKNENHKSCYILSVLHLLAQTNLRHLLQKSEIHENCETHGACILGNFLKQYQNCATFFPHKLIENPATFGVKQFSFVVAELIRLFLKSTVTDEQNCVSTAYRTILEWKFECASCHRFVKTRLEDFVLKIHANEPNSFESHLRDFLFNKTCSCGAVCKTDPSVKQAGDFIFVEVDRSKNQQMGSEECEMSLYSLKLFNSYKIFGETYQVFGTINLNLNCAEGGHYVCNILVGGDEVVTIHEDSVERSTIWPAFDNDAIIIGLQKNKTVNENDAVYVSESSNESVIDTSGVNPSLPCTELYDCNKPRSGSCAENTEMVDAGINEVVVGLDHPESEHESENCTEMLDPDYLSFVNPSLDGGLKEANKTNELPRLESSVKKKDLNKRNIMLVGDNLRLYLNDDRQIVQKYREEYIKKVEKAMNSDKDSVKDVSLRSLGGQVLTSKVYRIQSLSGSKKRRKNFCKLDSGMIDNDIKGNAEKNELSLRLDIPEEVGILDINM